MKNCLYCNTELEGRTDKLFCTPYCKSSYHYKKKKEQKPTFYQEVDLQLKLNRKLLKQYNKSGFTTIRKEVLIDNGFNPRFFTHYWKNQKNEVYLFCYEYGFLSKKHNGKEKFVLIQWQDYMF